VTQGSSLVLGQPDSEALTPAESATATKLLHDGVDVVTVAKLGGWSTPAQVLSTYAHAKDDPNITDTLFDTELAQPKTASNKNNDLV